jgi:proteasome lid subunit RPN8/RPN11
VVQGSVQIKKQVPGLRIPPTWGCRSCERPEVSPAHTCNLIIHAVLKMAIKKLDIGRGRDGHKKPLIRQAGSAGALIGSAAAGRELNCKIAYPVMRSVKILCCVSLNGANEVIATRVVSVGPVNKTQVHPREVFADPLSDRASAFIVAHNHPSGSLEPSKKDIDITGQLESAGEILDIRLLDHIVSTKKANIVFLKAVSCRVDLGNDQVLLGS